ncbi:PQQ-dependent sugar dehydrogenase [Mariniblastus fucicola]|uniref:Soluble aldose sugar dehydrogenase YliI n=1 Tax=Mariniblastus fucicola TaxID=980251 RepID=A0A5B9PMB4_9BACT|nr:PQQ-dependent sugar dehydrogenase [Mariniblastus fucicola]QEG23463.1 Soluble aldose sugar dehydrogenase YliI precursor [Mariniblastus fucicola]
MSLFRHASVKPIPSNEPATLAAESLEDRQMLSSVQIIAAGVENTESMSLEISGQVVQTWNNIGGDAYAGQFQTFNYNTPDDVSIGNVRVNFLNDVYDPANGIDSNLRVDAVVIDGTRYETEAPNTFSTGTWLPGVGIEPGQTQSEYLHASGFFQYVGGGNVRTQINVNARGTTGQESFALQIDGQTVATFDDVNTVFSGYDYIADGEVTADQIRVVFLNDAYDPANGIDRNLIVDDIVVNVLGGSNPGAIQYEAEAAEVYSTGTWTAADGVVPGFGRGDTLHSNGYFQFASDSSPVNGGNFSLEASQYSVAEGDGNVEIRIVRTGGSDGVVSLNYLTGDATATAGQDYQSRSGVVTFQDGETSKSIFVPISDDSQGEQDEQFSFAIDNLVGSGTLLAPRTALITIDDNDSVQGTGDGLRAEYFNNANLTDRVFTRVDPNVNFDWGTGTPNSQIGIDTFSIRWTGEIESRYSETYTFNTRSDDGVRLYVDGQLIIDEWNDHAATNHTGTIFLEAGVRYDIRLEYYENALDAEMRLRWSSATQNFEAVPTSQLYAADAPPNPGENLTAETVVSGLAQPTSIAWSADGRNMYVAQKSGIVRVVRDGVLQSTPFADISAQVNNVRDRGLLDMAIHPDFENNPYVYLLFTYDPPEVYDNPSHALAGPDKPGNRAGRLLRVTADASTQYRTIVEGSQQVLLGSASTWNNFNAFANSTNDFNEPPAGIRANGTNIQDFIASDSESHTVGALAFGNDGNLFVSIGDGTSYNRVDPRTVRVQDIDNLSGKVLRIDPITGEGLSDNPFYNGNANANRSKVYHYGLRNPFRMTVDSATGQLYIGDVGWTQWEEVNTGPAGSNFGWPYFEGGSGNSLRTDRYDDLPEAQAFYNSGQSVVAPTFGLSHGADGINAIVLGSVYRGTTYPAEYQGSVLVNDLGQGIVRAVQLDSNGQATTVQTFTTGARIVVNMVEGPDGNMYYVDLDDGEIGRWVFN